MSNALHDDLVPWVQDAPVLGRLVHSPLLIASLFAGEYDLINRMYLRKKDALEEALKERRWEAVLWLHERPYRFGALRQYLGDKLAERDPKTYWRAVGKVWVDSENIWQNLDEWRELWPPILDEPVNYAMGKEQRQRLAALPDPVPVWRGFSHRDGANGLSWSFTQEDAVWFARRFAKGPCRLASGLAPKNKILALFDRENEIVIFPEDVKNRKVRTISRK